MAGKFMLTCAKRLADGERVTVYSRTEYFNALAKRAAASRRGGETEAQAFERYSRTEPDGRVLMRAALHAPDEDREDQDKPPDDRRRTNYPDPPDRAELAAAEDAEKMRKAAAAGDDAAFLRAASAYYRRATVR